MKSRFLKTTVAFAALLGISASAAYAASCTNDTSPGASADESGDLVGMEADMAKDVADAMGVELELVAVQSSNRMQFLEQGKIDMMIATMSDRDRPAQDRRHPAAELLHLRHQRDVAQGARHEELGRSARKPVCGKQGAFYNKIVTERYGAKVIAFTGNAEAKQALRDKKCIAWVYDDSSIMSDLSSGNYNDFEMPLNSEDDNPWGLAVPLNERTASSATSCPA